MNASIGGVIERLRAAEHDCRQDVDRAQARWHYRLTAPLVYSMLAPIALLDGWLSAYQAVCFRLYRIPRVRRSAFVVIDRHHLAYLNGIEKLNCVYCSYATGVFGYAREIAARTEKYWCAIKHARRIPQPHGEYHKFVDYGDAEGYHRELPRLRTDWTPDFTRNAGRRPH